MDLSLQNSGPFICEGGSSEPTEPPLATCLISNLVRSSTRRDTEVYVSNLSKGYSASPKVFWRWLNSFKGRRTPIPPLSCGDNCIVEDVSKAEAFNTYFSTVFTADDGSDVPVLRRSLSFHPSIIQSIEFNAEEVYNELRTLNCGKACGPDLLPSRLLKLNRAARWAAGSRWSSSSCCWSRSSDVCLKDLKWPSIHQRHIYFSVCQVHDILHNRNSISFSDYFQLSIRPASSSLNSYCFSFFVNSPFLWNAVPYNILRLVLTSPFHHALRRFLF